MLHMNTIQQFIQRNQHTYVKHSDAPKEVIEKYKKMYQGQSYFPEELIWIWENMGFGVYEDGFLQIVNPDEYEFVFEYIDKLLKPTVVWGVTALGDLLVWEGNDNWTIAPDVSCILDLGKVKNKMRKSKENDKISVQINAFHAFYSEKHSNLGGKLTNSRSLRNCYINTRRFAKRWKKLPHFFTINFIKRGPIRRNPILI